MTIMLKPDLQAFLDEQVRLGKYQSKEDAVADPGRRLKEREEKIAWLRRELQLGIDELDRGEVAERNVEELKAMLRAKFPNA